MNYLLLIIPIIGLIINTTILRKIFFFGIFFHELGHYIFAKILGLKIYKVKWLSSVEMEKPKSAWKSLLICFAPFAFSFFISAIILKLTLNTSYNIIGVFLATGIVIKSPSSKQDFKNFLISLKDVFKGKGSFLDYLILIVVAGIFLFSIIGYISFSINYLLIIALLIIAFMVLSVTTIFGEIASIFLLILMIIIFSGEIDITFIIENLKVFLNNIVSLVE